MAELKDITRDVVNDVINTARDAAYVAVGFSVITLQRAQVRRQELMKAFSDPRGGIDERLAKVRDDVTKVVKDVDGQLEQVWSTIEATVTPFEDRLPEPARDIVKQAHSQVREARAQLRGRLLQTLAA